MRRWGQTWGQSASAPKKPAARAPITADIEVSVACFRFRLASLGSSIAGSSHALGQGVHRHAVIEQQGRVRASEVIERKTFEAEQGGPPGKLLGEVAGCPATATARKGHGLFKKSLLTLRPDRRPPDVRGRHSRTPALMPGSFV